MDNLFSRFDRFPLFGLIAVFIAVSAFWWTTERYEVRVWQHIQTVLLEDEVMPGTHPVTRWNRPIGISLAGASQEDIGAVEDFVADLNVLLAGSSVRLGPARAQDADIWVTFVAAARIPELSKRVTGTVPEGPVYGQGSVFSQDGFTINHGYVIIAADVPVAHRRNLVFEEITQVLGPANDSPFFPSSIFYESEDGKSSKVLELSRLDRKLIRFLYLHLKPGDDLAALRRAYDRHWRTMTVPPRLKK